MMQESIQFKFEFQSEFWDQPPIIDICIDQTLLWSGPVNLKKQTIEFTHTLECGQAHTIAIRRYNKTDDQCVILSNRQRQDQYLIINQVIIDAVDIQNLVGHRSWYEPEYPELWAQQQQAQGIELESKVIGETWLGHNGTWYFQFTSPFYQYVIDQFR